MTVCRYFLQGNCRFGDRCRFEHVQNDYGYNQRYSGNYNQPSNQRYAGNYQERYGRQDTGYSDYNRHGNKYDSRTHYKEEYPNYSSNKYNENYGQSGDYDYQQQNRYKQNYQQQTRHNEQNYGRKSENVYGQNRFRWIADDYKKQSHPRADYEDDEYPSDSYTTSTPKGKPSFSFKVPESEIKRGGTSAFVKINEQDQLYAEQVKEDAKSWELGGQWPFTCYFPYNSKHAFPGFYDVSFEELRHAAYKATKDNNHEAYLQSVQNALMQIKKQRSELQIPTPQLLSTLRKLKDGEDLYSISEKFDPVSGTQYSDTIIESMDTPTYLTAVDKAAASFSFKMPVEEADSAVKAAASSFNFKLPAGTEVKPATSSLNFKLPAGTEIKAVHPDASKGNTEIYTPLENLTDEEKEQFNASTFVLGKIPTKPPPQVLCY